MDLLSYDDIAIAYLIKSASQKRDRLILRLKYDEYFFIFAYEYANYNKAADY
jgi:hypothetical protein